MAVFRRRSRDTRHSGRLSACSTMDAAGQAALYAPILKRLAWIWCVCRVDLSARACQSRDGLDNGEPLLAMILLQTIHACAIA